MYLVGLSSLSTKVKKSYLLYPARVKFRGFDEKSVGESYQKITDYLKDNVEELKKECDL